ncbi:MAG: NAD(P)/FAD-dependent oxidoreductase [Vicinamibacterales bacterium]
MSKTADVVVIGGGINGCTTAYALARRGVKRVVLVEKGHIASGPTGRSSGIVRQHYSHETLAAMARDSVKVWQNFEHEIGGDAGFVQCGVVFAVGPKDVESIKTTVAMHQRIGIDAHILSVADMKKLDPHLAAEGLACGAFEPGGGYADPALAAASYAEAAQGLGVEVLRKTTVTGLRIERGRMAGVTTSAGEIASPVVINVAGVWGGHIAAMAGAHIPIKASRHPVVLLRRPTSWRNPTPVWADLLTGWYFKPERNTAIMVGSLADSSDDVDPDNHSTTPTFAEIEEYSAGALTRFPIMEEGAAQGGWAGLYDVTPDWQPVIDRIPQVEGFICAVGFSGHGFKIGPAVGRAVAELALDGACRTYDLSLFRYSRFAAHQSSRGAYGFGIVG